MSCSSCCQLRRPRELRAAQLLPWEFRPRRARRTSGGVEGRGAQTPGFPPKLWDGENVASSCWRRILEWMPVGRAQESGFSLPPPQPRPALFLTHPFVVGRCLQSALQLASLDAMRPASSVPSSQMDTRSVWGYKTPGGRGESRG